MPTISQLPTAVSISPVDLIPISQSGSAHAISVGTLLSQVQPAIIIDPPSLLGRYSIGPGGPDVIAIGGGLTLNEGTLSSSSFDPTTLPVQTTLSTPDQFLIVNGTTAQLGQVSQIRDLFTAGSNIAIDSNGTISAVLPAQSASTNVASLPLVTTLSGQDLVAVNQGGQNSAVTYANLIDGISIDMTGTAVAASGTDSFLVAQGSETLVRQTLGAVWTWMSSQVPSLPRPVVELSGDTTLTASVHNAGLLVCNSPIAVSNASPGVQSGFYCDLINMSSGQVTFSGNILTPSGISSLGPNQSCSIYGVTWSGGTVAVASIGGTVASASTPPGQVTGVTAGSATTSSITVSWTAPATGGTVASYVVQYRVTGSGTWLTAGQTTATSGFAVTGLTASTSYDFTVLAENSAGTGSSSAIVSLTTSAAPVLPAAPTNVTISGITASGATCTWTMASPPSGVSYTVQYKLSSASSWTTAAAGITALSTSLTGLSASSTYAVQVIATDTAGSGPASASTSFTTSAAAGLVSAIVWNLVPSGSYSHGVGAIGVNVHVTPATAAVQFGFSQSSTSPPTSWTAGIAVNTDLWGAYAPTPATAGTYYAWAEGTDGSEPTVYATPFTVT